MIADRAAWRRAAGQGIGLAGLLCNGEIHKFFGDARAGAAGAGASEAAAEAGGDSEAMHEMTGVFAIARAAQSLEAAPLGWHYCRLAPGMLRGEHSSSGGAAPAKVAKTAAKGGEWAAADWVAAAPGEGGGADQGGFSFGFGS